MPTSHFILQLIERANLYEMIRLFVFGIGFGLAATIPPGPINTQIARRTVRFGLLPGLAFGAGSLAVENALAVAACLGLGGQFASSPRLTTVMLFVGFMVLAIVGTFALANGYRAWQDPAGTRREVKSPPSGDPNSAGLLFDPRAEARSPAGTLEKIGSMPRAFFAGLGMAIISPYTIIFWLVALPSAARDAIETSPFIWALPLGVFVGSTAWVGGFTAMLAWLKRYNSTGMWADLIGGVMLLGFAALTLLELARHLMRHGGLAPP